MKAAMRTFDRFDRQAVPPAQGVAHFEAHGLADIEANQIAANTPISNGSFGWDGAFGTGGEVTSASWVQEVSRRAFVSRCGS
jgi:hypothetical protein